MATASYVIAIETYAMVNGLSVTAYGLSAVTDEFPAMVFHLFTAPIRRNQMSNVVTAVL